LMTACLAGAYFASFLLTAVKTMLDISVVSCTLRRACGIFVSGYVAGVSAEIP
jgi:hypothetical protein